MAKILSRYYQVCPGYTQEIPNIYQRYAQDGPKIYPKYAQDIPKVSQRYTKERLFSNGTRYKNRLVLNPSSEDHTLSIIRPFFYLVQNTFGPGCLCNPNLLFVFLLEDSCSAGSWQKRGETLPKHLPSLRNCYSYGSGHFRSRNCLFVSKHDEHQRHFQSLLKAKKWMCD